MNNKSPLAIKLIELRKSKGLTQEQVAEHTGVSLRTIQRLEADKVKPQLNTLCQLAQLFDINIEELTAFEKASAENPKPAVTRANHRAEVVLLHLSPLCMFIFPAAGNILGPVLFWLWKRDKNEAVNRQGIQLINFQISITLYLLTMVFSVVFFFFASAAGKIISPDIQASGAGFATALLLGGLAFLTLSFIGIMLWNAFVSPRRESAFYPLAISFLKENKADAVPSFSAHS